MMYGLLNNSLESFKSCFNIQCEIMRCFVQASMKANVQKSSQGILFLPFNIKLPFTAPDVWMRIKPYQMIMQQSHLTMLLAELMITGGYDYEKFDDLQKRIQGLSLDESFISSL